MNTRPATSPSFTEVHRRFNSLQLSLSFDLLVILFKFLLVLSGERKTAEICLIIFAHMCAFL